MAVAVAGAFCGSLPAQAITGILFDPTGKAGAGIALDAFTWTANAVLAQAAFRTSNSGVTPADVRIQDGFLLGSGQLDSASLGGTPVSNALFSNFTYEYKVPVKATTVVSTVNGAGSPVIANVTFRDRDLPDYGVGNFFRIYYTPTAPNAAAGTGYGTSLGEPPTAGQKLIFAGKVNVAPTSAYSSSSADTTTPIGDTGALFSQGGDTRVSITGSGSLALNIEQCSAANVAASLAQCFNGTTFIDSNYFRSDVEGFFIDVDLGVQMATPFPSGDIVPLTVGNQLPNFGGSLAGQVVDNFSCEGGTTPCDMLYDRQDATSHWFGTFVPEPGSVALLGLGLAGLGFGRRKNS